MAGISYNGYYGDMANDHQALMDYHALNTPVYSQRTISLAEYGDSVIKEIANQEFKKFITANKETSVIPDFLKKSFGENDVEQYALYAKGLAPVTADYQPIDVVAMVEEEFARQQYSDNEWQKLVNKKATQVLHQLDLNNKVIAEAIKLPNFEPLNSPVQDFTVPQANGKTVIPAYTVQNNQGSLSLDFSGIKVISSQNNENMTEYNNTDKNSFYPVHRSNGVPQYVVVIPNLTDAIKLATMSDAKNNEKIKNAWILSPSDPENTIWLMRDLCEKLPRTPILFDGDNKSYKDVFNFMNEVATDVAQRYADWRKDTKQSSMSDSRDWQHVASNIIFNHNNLPYYFPVIDELNKVVDSHDNQDLTERQQAYQNSKNGLGNITTDHSFNKAVLSEIYQRLENDVVRSGSFMLRSDIENNINNDLSLSRPVEFMNTTQQNTSYRIGMR